MKLTIEIEAPNQLLARRLLHKLVRGGCDMSETVPMGADEFARECADPDGDVVIKRKWQPGSR